MASQLNAYSNNTRVQRESRYDHLNTYSPRPSGNGLGVYFALAAVVISLAGLVWLLNQ